MNKMTTLILALLFSLPVLTQNTPQQYCGTTELRPEQEANLEAFQQQQLKHKEALGQESAIEYYLPMKLHIVGRTDGTGYADLSLVLGSICTLNEWFASSNIQFFLADEINYIDNSNYYEHNFRQSGFMMNANNVSDRVNVYIVADAAGACGYYSPQMDAVSISRTCLFGEESTTLAHEIGHYLSMPHTFDGWEGGEPPAHEQELADGSNCRNAGDGFCDTPADYLPYRWNCPYRGETLIDPNGDTVIPDETQIMSYSTDVCQTGFSKEQEAAMRNYINNHKQGMVASFVPHSGSMAKPKLVKPVGNEPSIPTANATFSWNSVPNSFGYQVQISRFYAMVNNTVNVMVTDTSFTTSELNPGTSYYWRVRPLAKGNTCTDYTETQAFEVADVTGMDSQPERSVSIFPNPSKQGDGINVHFGTNKVAEGTVELMDLTGKVIATQQISGSETTINTANASQGVYLIKVRTPAFNTVRKVTIQ